jgi:23S rRNA (cytidine1920-2'-O)/16S rRNA (cytidine1409-2'-O)-methyltransferase
MRVRLDTLLVARRLVATRSRARDLIARGEVLVAGRLAAKAGELVAEDVAVEIATDRAGVEYVSRGALKLLHALDLFGFSPAGRIALDIGASTGGFSEVLLERGAERIYAVDVGNGQLHPRLAADPRLVVLERLDARRLDSSHVPEPVMAIVADVSFISLTLVLPAALTLAAPGCWLVALVKPQFEAGPEAVGKGGIVRDRAARDAAFEKVRAWLESQPGWRVIGAIPSPIAGKGGNIEHLLGAVRDG